MIRAWLVRIVHVPLWCRGTVGRCNRGGKDFECGGRRVLASVASLHAPVGGWKVLHSVRQRGCGTNAHRSGHGHGLAIANVLLFTVSHVM